MLDGRVEYRLEVIPGQAPISGDVVTEQGERLAFVGWAQLVSVIERLISEEAGLAAIDEIAPPVHVPRRKP